MNRRLIVGIAAGAVLLVGIAVIITQDDDDATPLDYCALAVERVTITEVLDPFTIDVTDTEKLRATLEEAEATLRATAAAAPSEIADDYDVIVDAFDEVFQLFEETDFDFERLAAEFDSQELADRIDADAVSTAESAIETYEATVCAQLASSTTLPSATEIAELIRETFSDEELRLAFDFVGVDTIEELANAIVDKTVSLEDLDRAMQRAIDQPYEVGDSPELDVLHANCASGDLVACDALYEAAPLNSRYERFAATCGERTEAPIGGRCEAEL